MQLTPNNIYHIYNQGNNRQPIFFNRENYLFFLKKIRTHITPFADIIAWCLMPNHFHLMVYYRINDTDDATEGVAQSHPLDKKYTLNQSIGKMQGSYTQAINKQEKRSGSLFRQDCKAENITDFQGITPSYYKTAFGTSLRINMPETEYPQVCFDYIHTNPVRAKLVKHPSEWEFSSYNDYYNNRKGTLINREVAKKFINI